MNIQNASQVSNELKEKSSQGRLPKMEGGVVIVAFPGCGKTHAKKMLGDKIIDHDTAPDSWEKDENGNLKLDENGKKIRKPDYFQNYAKEVNQLRFQYDYVCVTSHQEVRDELNKQNIPYVVIYPPRDMKDEMIQRYIDRGSPDSFVKTMSNNFEMFLNTLENDVTPNKIVLKPSQHLSDVLREAKEMVSK